MTISVDKLRAVKTIITHDNCADGLASAMILKSVLPQAEVRFLSYNSVGQKELDATPGMIFCDFSPCVERVREFVDAGAIVLDHHKYQKDVVAAFGTNGVFADETQDVGVSGALLAFREVWLPLVSSDPVKYLRGAARASYDKHTAMLSQAKGQVAKKLMASNGGHKPSLGQVDDDAEVKRISGIIDSFVNDGANRHLVERFATLVGIRDTWQTGSGLWHEARELNESLMFFAKDVWLKAPIFPDPGIDQDWNMRMGMGHFLVEKKERKVSKVIEGAYKAKTSNGIQVLIHEGISAVSDVAERLRTQPFDLVLAFSYFVERDADLENWPATSDALGPKIAVSCRSKGSFDVGAFAKAHGGGGHSKASGFSYHVKPNDPNPYVYLLNLVQEYKTL